MNNNLRSRAAYRKARSAGTVRPRATRSAYWPASAGLTNLIARMLRESVKWLMALGPKPTASVRSGLKLSSSYTKRPGPAAIAARSKLVSVCCT